MINYPNGKKTAWTHAPARFGDRGMNLEKDINTTNQYYLDMDRAVIHKKPTPVQIVKVDYPKRSAAKITEAYFKTPSTTDYNGVYRGKYIDFEAKECQSKTAFSLSYIHPHQITHLEKCRKHGGICFVIFRLTYHNLTYLVDAQEMIDYIHRNSRNVIQLNGDSACRKIGSPKVLNMVMLGAVLRSNVLPLTMNEVTDVMEKTVKPQFIELNKKALNYEE